MKLRLKVVYGAAQERYWFCNAPASLHEPEAAAQLLRFAGTYAARRPVALAHAEQARRVRVPVSPEQLRRLESIHSVRSLGQCRCMSKDFGVRTVL